MSTMNSELAECCLVCLEKNAPMINLKGSGEKLIKLSALAHVEFSNYTEYSHLLCTLCDERLISSYSFLQQVLKRIQFLDERKNGIETSTGSNKETTDSCDTQTNSNQASRSNVTYSLDDSSHIRRTPTSSIKPIPIEDVNNAIEAFKKDRGKCDNCLICGFTVSQRKYLIKHMAGHHMDHVPDWCRDCNGIYENIEEHRKTHSRKYPCTFCGKMFRANSYVEHVMCHAGAFKCDMCGNMLNSSSSLKKHKFLHTNHRPHRCPNCMKGFLQASALRYHLINIHGKLSCETCTKHFSENDKLLHHECVEVEPKVESSSNVNKSAEKLVERSPACLESSDDSGSLKDADEIFGDPSESFGGHFEDEYCEKCDKMVKSLERHTANYHSKLMCELCQKEFRSSYKLQLHVQIHKGTVPNECRYCQKKFHHKVKLIEHERTHTKEKPYECNFCQKSFTQKSVLNTHMKQHTGRPEVCDICGKRFCRKSELRLHLSKHTGEKPHLCSICGKNFGQKSHLNQHMISHREDRPHQCPFCEKAFKRNELLKGHLRLHSGNKPFKCSHCSYTCYRQYRLREHMKVHTGHASGIPEQAGKEDRVGKKY